MLVIGEYSSTHVRTLVCTAHCTSQISIDATTAHPDIVAQRCSAIGKQRIGRGEAVAPGVGSASAACSRAAAVAAGSAS